MSIYLDASVAVALLAAETRADAVRRWLSGRPTGYGVVSWWVDTEVSSALARRRRMGELTAEREDVARFLWQSVQAAVLRIVSVELSDYATAAHFCAQQTVTLRGADALHLAIAKRHGLGMATFDKGMAVAAGQLGVRVETVP